MSYLKFWRDVTVNLTKGGARYYAWLLVLFAMIAIGMYHYSIQLDIGLSHTNLTHQVSWGAYIANFTFLVGVAAAAVLLVVPSYVFHLDYVKKVVIYGELLAMSAIIMCLAFVIVDIGRPDRAGHIIPLIGRLNLPGSMLAWDVVVLNGYLLLNLHIPGYLLYQKYRGRPPSRKYYMPFVYTSIFWAVCIHTVTAFLYSGFGSRPFWNSAILAPRFLISAFTSGPALLIIVFTLVRVLSTIKLDDKLFTFLRRVMTVMLPINLFLYACELFKEFYTDNAHAISVYYLFFGIDGHAVLTPYIWTSIIFSFVSLYILLHPKLKTQQNWLLAACGMIFLAVWIEKGMGLIIPGFIPTPLGELAEYSPSMGEFFISLGIWAIGALLYTFSLKTAIAIDTKQLSSENSSS